MRHLALSIAAVFMLALVAPAFAQPFADVPADHWAFDAIAELAAKGILEGFPDGTFKGDRAMTRYEMAMALARILARIEAIKIPPPPKIPPPEVSRADIDRLQRLINEFRAELSALGVRITAVEEELAALRARLDNTKITGDIRFRFEDRKFPTIQSGFCVAADGVCEGLGPNGTNVTTGGTSLGDATFAGNPSVLTFRARTRIRLRYTGQVAPDVVAVVRLTTGNMNWSSSATNLWVNIDLAYLDWNTSFGGMALKFRIGRQQSVALGPIGLLLNTDWDAFGTQSGFNYNFDAAKVETSLGPLTLVGVIGRINGGGNAGGWDAWGFEAKAQLIPGWTIGGYYLKSDTHGVNQVIYYQNLGSFQAGTADGSGWGWYVTGDLLPGVTLTAEYATWSPTNNLSFGGACADLDGDEIIAPSECTPALIPGTSDNGYKVSAAINLGQFGLATYSPMLTVSYMNYGSNFMPPLGATEDPLAGSFVTGQFNGWDAVLDLTLSPRLTAQFEYASGNGVCSWVNLLTVPCNAFGFNFGAAQQTAAWSQWHVNLTYTLSRNYTAAFDYFRFDGDVDQGNNAPVPGKEDLGTIYRFTLNFRW